MLTISGFAAIISGLIYNGTVYTGSPMIVSFPTECEIIIQNYVSPLMSSSIIVICDVDP